MSDRKAYRRAFRYRLARTAAMMGTAHAVVAESWMRATPRTGPDVVLSVLCLWAAAWYLAMVVVIRTGIMEPLS